MTIERISPEQLSEDRKQIRKEAVKKARKPRYREGCLSREKVRAGWSYRQGVGRVGCWKERWVAEFNYYGKRTRCRSSSRQVCEDWLRMMRNMHND